MIEAQVLASLTAAAVLARSGASLPTSATATYFGTAAYQNGADLSAMYAEPLTYPNVRAADRSWMKPPTTENKLTTTYVPAMPRIQIVPSQYDEVPATYRVRPQLPHVVDSVGDNPYILDRFAAHAASNVQNRLADRSGVVDWRNNVRLSTNRAAVLKVMENNFPFDPESSIAPTEGPIHDESDDCSETDDGESKPLTLMTAQDCENRDGQLPVIIGGVKEYTIACPEVLNYQPPSLAWHRGSPGQIIKQGKILGCDVEAPHVNSFGRYVEGEAPASETEMKKRMEHCFVSPNHRYVGVTRLEPLCPSEFHFTGMACVRTRTVPPVSYCKTGLAFDSDCEVVIPYSFRCPRDFHHDDGICLKQHRFETKPSCPPGYQLSVDHANLTAVCSRRVELPRKWQCPAGAEETDGECYFEGNVVQAEFVDGGSIEHHVTPAMGCPDGFDSRRISGIQTCLKMEERSPLRSCPDRFIDIGTGCARRKPVNFQCPLNAAKEILNGKLECVTRDVIAPHLVYEIEAECIGAMCHEKDPLLLQHGGAAVVVLEESVQVARSACPVNTLPHSAGKCKSQDVVPALRECPAGTDSRGDTCVTFVEKAGRCPDGYFEGPQGTCFNYSHAELQVRCPNGFHPKESRCVRYVPHAGAHTCPEGSVIRAGRCYEIFKEEATALCSPGFIFDGVACVKTVETECPTPEPVTATQPVLRLSLEQAPVPRRLQEREEIVEIVLEEPHLPRPCFEELIQEPRFVCERGHVEDRSCVVVREIPKVSSEVTLTEFAEPKKLCPDGYVRVHTLPSALTAGPVPLNDVTQCVRVNMADRLHECPTGSETWGEKCAVLSSPRLECPEGSLFELSEEGCVELVDTEPAVTYSLQFRCEGLECIPPLAAQPALDTLNEPL